MAEKKTNLFSEFPPVPASAWEALVLADLKGKDFARTLIWKTYEGIEVKPYYRKEDLQRFEFQVADPNEFPFIRGNKTDNDWYIRQDIFVSDIETANKKALSMLEKGVSSIGFYFDCLHKITTDDLILLLKNIPPETTEINFVCSCKNCNCAEEFLEYIGSGNFNAERIIASSAVDPIGTFMLRGVFEGESEENAFIRLKSLVEKSSILPHFRVIGIQGKFFGNSGSSIVQELAFSLATGAEYLTRLTDLGLSPDIIAKNIKFNFSISGNYFFEIAKLRAARLLWAKIFEAYQPDDEKSAQMIIHCETGTFNKTLYDLYVNLLRTQTEAMSATLGGIHSLTILPFDYVNANSVEFSERIARNQQILLKEEAYFNKVSDPSAGSYYIENLTTSLAEVAWKLFLQVEKKGGFLASFREGFIQSQIGEIAGKKSKNLAIRRENLLGINQFPNPNDAIKTELNFSVFQPSDYSEKGSAAETLKPFRLAQPFEVLRFRTDRYSLTNKRPVVFLLTYGNLALRKARALFSINFFIVAGFNVFDSEGFLTAEEGMKAAREAKADIVVVCSSDDEYAGFVPEVARFIDREILVVAGNPECRPVLEERGIINFIHVKSNILEELKRFQEILGII